MLPMKRYSNSPFVAVITRLVTETNYLNLETLVAWGNSKGTVIFIHGGCWMKEYDIGHSYAFSTALASAGYAVWSIEYRRTGDLGGGWPGTFMDVISGINKLNDLGEFGLNMERLVLMGHSAGGHLAILAGARSGLLDLKPSLVLGLAAITDVETYARGLNSCQKSASAFMGGGPDEFPDMYEEVQAVNYGVDPNTVLLFGPFGSNCSIVSGCYYQGKIRSSGGCWTF